MQTEYGNAFDFRYVMQAIATRRRNKLELAARRCVIYWTGQQDWLPDSGVTLNEPDNRTVAGQWCVTKWIVQQDWLPDSGVNERTGQQDSCRTVVSLNELDNRTGYRTVVSLNEPDNNELDNRTGCRTTGQLQDSGVSLNELDNRTGCRAVMSLKEPDMTVAGLWCANEWTGQQDSLPDTMSLKEPDNRTVAGQWCH
jgi:hypothetical protein